MIEAETRPLVCQTRLKPTNAIGIEKQADMYLSTLGSYVVAVGGELELTVKLPQRPTLRIHHLGNVSLAPKKIGSPASPLRADRRWPWALIIRQGLF